jgi:hypothetical protein
MRGRWRNLVLRRLRRRVQRRHTQKDGGSDLAGRQDTLAIKETISLSARQHDRMTDGSARDSPLSDTSGL